MGIVRYFNESFDASPTAISTLATRIRHIKDEKEKTILKEITLRKQFDVRVRAFANVWMQRLKLISFKTERLQINNGI